MKSLLFQFGIKISEKFTDSQSESWPKHYLEWLNELVEGSEEVRVVIRDYVEIGM